jgi:hypothetical protein
MPGKASKQLAVAAAVPDKVKMRDHAGDGTPGFMLAPFNIEMQGLGANRLLKDSATKAAQDFGRWIYCCIGSAKRSHSA